MSTEGGQPPTPGTAEFYQRLWTAHDGILRNGAVLEERYGLDPMFLDRLKDAFRGGTNEEVEEALADFLTALAETSAAKED